MITLKAPEYPINTTVSLSGSKSISNRLLILNKVLNSSILVHNLSDSEDTRLLVKAISQINTCNESTIDVHHAGTDMRFLTALLSITPGKWLLTGSDRLLQRPISELVAALKNLGAEINFVGEENYPPLSITGKKIQGNTVRIKASVSSQFISALLMIAPAMENGLILELEGDLVSGPYLKMTIELMREFGLRVTQKHNVISVLPVSSHTPPLSYKVEADWSSASYWYSICALSPDSFIRLPFLTTSSLQADSVLPQLYTQFGVQSRFNQGVLELKQEGSSITDFDFDFTNCPDIAQTVVVTCLGLGINVSCRGLQTLRLKETDRINAMKTELEKFGLLVVTNNSSLSFKTSRRAVTSTHPPAISTYNDHRMAMSFAPLALSFRALTIEAPEVVNKSYPRFWSDLKTAGFNVNLQP